MYAGKDLKKTNSGDVHTYIHTHIHNTYIHTQIRTYIHTYIHTYKHTYIHTYMHTCMYAGKDLRRTNSGDGDDSGPSPAKRKVPKP